MIRTALPHNLVTWMEGLAEPTRLRVLRLLEQAELTVAELCDVLQMPQSTVSRHLKMLSDLGWVRSHRSGTANLYRLDQGQLASGSTASGGGVTGGGAGQLWQLARRQMEGWPTLEQDRLRLERVLAQRPRDPDSFFEGVAGQWDQWRQSLYGPHLNQSVMLGLLPADWVVADLGCGTGALTAELAKFTARVIGIDQSPAMLKAARQRVAKLPHVELHKAALTQLPLAGSACNAALLVIVLTYIPEPLAVLREALRILKPGGRLVITDLLLHDRDDFRRRMGQHWPGFAPAQLTHWLKEAGAADIHIHPLPTEPDAKGPALQLATATK